MINKWIKFSLKKPYLVIATALTLIVLALLQLPKVIVDTDPENMLSDKEFARIFHHQTKKEFGLSDFIVVGIVNEKHSQGVFNRITLKRVYQLTEYIKTIEGVVEKDIMAPSTKEDVEQAGIGALSFGWLMPKVPETDAAAQRIRLRAMANPLYNGTLVSENGKALCLYVPIKEKDMSYKVSKDIRQKWETIAKGLSDEQFYITGLPVAEDTFGHQMFKQMAISAPLAGLLILVILFFFFRKFSLVIAPMILAIITVVMTMGLLVGFGFPVHIMSSMIPIFLMPIAVLDSVHILSEFFDEYHIYNDKSKTIEHVIKTLFVPMLYTSLTTFAGFISLSFSNIPPVQVFGVFVALGVVIAWILTMIFIPAYIALIPDKILRSLKVEDGDKKDLGPLNTFLQRSGEFSLKNPKLIIIAALIVTAISVWGISRIIVNDNPVRWFNKNHPIRIADKKLNENFGGTYMAYLVLESDDGQDIFKEPKMLNYLSGLQAYLINQGSVGKTTSLADVVKKLYFELMGGSDTAYYSIPKSRAAVAQCIIQFENSRKPDDLWHMVTPDFKKLNFWIQLKGGDNKDTELVLQDVADYFEQNPSPYKINKNWAGLTYVNVVWQNNMVVGMLRNFLGSFIIVYFMMVFLLGTPLRAMISMLPLSLTIVFIYGLLGITGKYYDMPVAVLSALTLGLSVDFAIHFIQRSRELYVKDRDWATTAKDMFRSPSMAIARNAIVVALGFTPLLFAPLMPYKTVGLFMALIMLVSSLSTLYLLPAIIDLSPAVIFEEKEKHFLCYCSDFFFFSCAVALTVVYFLLSYTKVTLSVVIVIALCVLALMMILCKTMQIFPAVCNFLDRFKSKISQDD